MSSGVMALATLAVGLIVGCAVGGLIWAALGWHVAGVLVGLAILAALVYRGAETGYR